MDHDSSVSNAMIGQSSIELDLSLAEQVNE